MQGHTAAEKDAKPGLLIQVQEGSPGLYGCAPGWGEEQTHGARLWASDLTSTSAHANLFSPGQLRSTTPRLVHAYLQPSVGPTKQARGNHSLCARLPALAVGSGKQTQH